MHHALGFLLGTKVLVLREKAVGFMVLHLAFKFV